MTDFNVKLKKIEQVAKSVPDFATEVKVGIQFLILFIILVTVFLAMFSFWLTLIPITWFVCVMVTNFNRIETK